MILNFEKDKFLELMKDINLSLPKEWHSIDFIQDIKVHLEYYTNSLQDVVDADDLNDIKRISKLIILSIQHYHNGLPTKAYNTFELIMKSIIDRPVRIYQKTGDILSVFDDDPLIFYRIRHVNDEKEYSREDIFHTPFTLRSKIGTCRYSIAGYPCLYLGTTLKLCNAEVKKANASLKTIASKFKLVRSYKDSDNDIKVIELGVKPADFIYNDGNSNMLFDELDLLNESVMYNYLFWYPVIASCSYIRRYKNDSFASEYIMPQLLMQWIRVAIRKGKMYGIRYFSCASKEASNHGFNYVFPAFVDEKESTDFCTVLSKCFKLTKPIMMDLVKDEGDIEHELNNDNELLAIKIKYY